MSNALRMLDQTFHSGTGLVQFFADNGRLFCIYCQVGTLPKIGVHLSGNHRITRLTCPRCDNTWVLEESL